MPRAETVSREHLLDVVSELFYSRGTQAVGMAELAAQLGCGKQALYRHFPGKDQLVAAYLTRVLDERDASARRAAKAAGDDPADQLVALTEEAAAWVVRPEARGCAARNFLRETAAVDGPGARVAEAYLARSRRRIARLARDVDPAHAAELTEQIWLVHDGLHAAMRGTPCSVAAAVGLVASLVGRPRQPAARIPFRG